MSNSTLTASHKPLIVPFDNASGPVATGNQAWLVGEAASTQRAFEGAIDELRVWDRVRTANEILNHQKQVLTGTEPGLMVYLPMNEGIGEQTHRPEFSIRERHYHRSEVDSRHPGRQCRPANNR